MALAERGCHGDGMHTKLQLLILFIYLSYHSARFRVPFEGLLSDYRGQIIRRSDMKLLRGKGLGVKACKSNLCCRGETAIAIQKL